MRPALTTEQQLLHLRRNPICEGRGDIRRSALVWEFDARPTPSSRAYSLRLELSAVGALTVIVDKPDLILLANGKPLPHVYREVPVVLCLFHPDYHEWQPWMRLDETVVPWAYVWLLYFEDWLVDGKWRGGGEHPDPSTFDRATRRRPVRDWSTRAKAHVSRR